MNSEEDGLQPPQLCFQEVGVEAVDFLGFWPGCWVELSCFLYVSGLGSGQSGAVSGLGRGTGLLDFRSQAAEPDDYTDSCDYDPRSSDYVTSWFEQLLESWLTAKRRPRCSINFLHGGHFMDESKTLAEAGGDSEALCSETSDPYTVLHCVMTRCLNSTHEVLFCERLVSLPRRFSRWFPSIEEKTLRSGFIGF